MYVTQKNRGRCVRRENERDVYTVVEMRFGKLSLEAGSDGEEAISLVPPLIMIVLP